MKGITGESLRLLEHRPIMLESNYGESLLIACARCCYYTSGGQVRGLRKKYVGPPRKDKFENGCRYSWSCILKGRHPKSGAPRLFVFQPSTVGQLRLPRLIRVCTVWFLVVDVE